MQADVRPAIYTRVSTPLQCDGYSLQVQEEVCRRYIVQRGWCAPYDLVPVYEERGIRAHRTSRPALDRLFAAVDDGAVTHVVCQFLDRLGRGDGFWSPARRLEDRAVELICLDVEDDLKRNDMSSASVSYTVLRGHMVDQEQRTAWRRH